jgi:hypothetical protein
MSLVTRLSQDTVLAIVLLLISGGLMIASFDIREPDYGQLSPAAWPRAVVAALGFLSFLYLLQSLKAATSGETSLPDEAVPSEAKEVEPMGAAAFLAYWRNVIWCFVLFLAYLLTMPYLGMLIGGVFFAFLLMTALGGWTPRQLLLHAAIAIIAIGGMWALFTFGLKVPLPPGQILPRF